MKINLEDLKNHPNKTLVGLIFHIPECELNKDYEGTIEYDKNGNPYNKWRYLICTHYNPKTLKATFVEFSKHLGNTKEVQYNPLNKGDVYFQYWDTDKDGRNGEYKFSWARFDRIHILNLQDFAPLLEYKKNQLNSYQREQLFGYYGEKLQNIIDNADLALKNQRKQVQNRLFAIVNNKKILCESKTDGLYVNGQKIFLSDNKKIPLKFKGGMYRTMTTMILNSINANTKQIYVCPKMIPFIEKELKAQYPLLNLPHFKTISENDFFIESEQKSYYNAVECKVLRTANNAIAFENFDWRREEVLIEEAAKTKSSINELNKFDWTTTAVTNVSKTFKYLIENQNSCKAKEETKIENKNTFDKNSNKNHNR